MNHQTKQLGVFLSITALMAILAIYTRGYFTAANITDLFLAIMPVAIISIGMTLIILTGHIDVSVGSIFAVCSVVMGACATKHVPICACAVIALGLGTFCGALNGALTAYLKIPSIVVTLATMVILRDGLRWSTQGEWISNLPKNFQWFGFSSQTYTVICVVCVAGLIILSIYSLRHLRTGRIIFAAGSNADAARVTGINTALVVFCVFALTGFLTALAASINAVRFNQIPSNLGLGLEMKVIAAVAVGGAEITGGSASILGTVLGVILLGCISSALTFLQINAYWEKAIQGGIILLAVATGAIELYRKQNVKALAN
jgi:rhamnose transport system permease protein